MTENKEVGVGKSTGERCKSIVIVSKFNSSPESFLFNKYNLSGSFVYVKSNKLPCLY